MHILKRLTITILFISLVAFSLYFCFGKLTTDDTIPVISSTEENIEVSVYSDEAELYEGITAWDDKDGDITDKVFVEEISNFIRQGVCNITYAVVDSDNHVAKLTRKLTYSDYESPRFTVNSALVFIQGQTFSMLDYIGATDSVDGDISDKVKLVSSTIDTTEEGTYEITVQATNSFGDVISETLPVKVVSSKKMSVTIELSTYIIYAESGDSIDPDNYIESVTGYYGEKIDADDVEIDSSVDLNTPGVYTIEYSVKDENDNKGLTNLIVVVME